MIKNVFYQNKFTKKNLDFFLENFLENFIGLRGLKPEGPPSPQQELEGGARSAQNF